MQAQLDFWQKRLGAQRAGVERARDAEGGFTLREGRAVKVTREHLKQLSQENARNQMDFVLNISAASAANGSLAHARIFGKRLPAEKLLEVADTASRKGWPNAAAAILETVANLQLQKGGKSGVRAAQRIVDRLRSDELGGNGHAKAALILDRILERQGVWRRQAKFAK